MDVDILKKVLSVNSHLKEELNSIYIKCLNNHSKHIVQYWTGCYIHNCHIHNHKNYQPCPPEGILEYKHCDEYSQYKDTYAKYTKPKIEYDKKAADIKLRIPNKLTHTYCCIKRHPIEKCTKPLKHEYRLINIICKNTKAIENVRMTNVGTILPPQIGFKRREYQECFLRTR